MIPSFKQFLVEENREAFFTFGRMNPPTIGHGKLMGVLSTKAGRNPYFVYLSHSQDPKKNPLTYDQKIKHVRKMFPKHARSVILDKKVKNVFDIANKLYSQGFNRITMVVGQDRITEFQTLLNKYNGTKARHGFYNFEKINVVSAGDRDPDAEGVEGMSASKQRTNVSKNDFTTFSQGVPSTMSDRDTKRLFNDLRTGMGLKEKTDFKNHIDLGVVSETRERYVSGELFQPGDRVLVKEMNKEGEIYRLGTNYVIVALDEGRVTRQWLDGVERINEVDNKRPTTGKTDHWYKDQPEWGTPESTKKAKKITPNEDTAQDPDIKDRKGTQPKRYHSGLKKATKIARDRHFKKHGKKADDDSSAYKPAPGDKNAKTKPSKYTTAYKRMFDEKKRAPDEVSIARATIDRELDADKIRHDRMIDRARIAKARRKARETDPRKESTNPVAKYARKFNKAAVHTDKKKAVKRGYVKHKGKEQ